MADAGLLEVVSHGYNEVNFGSATEDEILTEVKDGMATFRKNGFAPTQHVYVGGAEGGQFGKGVVAEEYHYAWDTAVGKRFDEDVRDPYSLPRREGDGATTSEIKTMIDNAVANNSSVPLMSHHVIQGTQSDAGPLETSTQKIKDVIDYARNQGMAVVSPSDFCRSLHDAVPVGRRRRRAT